VRLRIGLPAKSGIAGRSRRSADGAFAAKEASITLPCLALTRRFGDADEERLGKVVDVS